MTVNGVSKEHGLDESSEVSPAELERSKYTPMEGLEKDEDSKKQGLDPVLQKALKLREQRRKLILPRLEDDDVPEWLKHAVDTEDTEYFALVWPLVDFPRKRLGRNYVFADFLTSSEGNEIDASMEVKRKANC